MWWDTSEPYDYLRVDPYADHDYVIFGGEDVKTGQEEDTNYAFQRLKSASTVSCLWRRSSIGGWAKSSRRMTGCPSLARTHTANSLRRAFAAMGLRSAR